MKTIKANSQRGKGYIESYKRSRFSELWQVYKSNSTDKNVAQIKCKAKMANEGGSDYRIIGHNCNYFTVAWKVNNNLRIETAYNSYLIVNAF